MGPEPSVIVSTFLLAGMTHRLAGKSSTNQIDRFQFLAGQRGHILVAWDVGPVLRQHATTPGVLLHLPRNLIASSNLEPEIHPPNTTKQ